MFINQTTKSAHRCSIEIPIIFIFSTCDEIEVPKNCPWSLASRSHTTQFLHKEEFVIIALGPVHTSHPPGLDVVRRELNRKAVIINSSSVHYYKNVDLSRLGNRCCPGFPTGNACPGQKGVPFCPGCGNRDKRSLFLCFSFLNSFSISIILLHFN